MQSEHSLKLDKNALDNFSEFCSLLPSVLFVRCDFCLKMTHSHDAPVCNSAGLLQKRKESFTNWIKNTAGVLHVYYITCEIVRYAAGAFLRNISTDGGCEDQASLSGPWGAGDQVGT